MVAFEALLDDSVVVETGVLSISVALRCCQRIRPERMTEFAAGIEPASCPLGALRLIR
jgi:hypothetical protein